MPKSKTVNRTHEVNIDLGDYVITGHYGHYNVRRRAGKYTYKNGEYVFKESVQDSVEFIGAIDHNIEKHYVSSLGHALRFILDMARNMMSKDEINDLDDLLIIEKSIEVKLNNIESTLVKELDRLTKQDVKA